MRRHKEVDAPAPATESPESPALDLAIAAETLTGDLRDLVLDTLRREQGMRPWHERGEAEQTETVSRVEGAVHAWVTRALELVSAQGQPAIKATVESVTVKDGIKAVLMLSKFDPLRHALADAQGKAVTLVVADSGDFEGERAPVPIQPDQKALPMAEHSDPED